MKLNEYASKSKFTEDVVCLINKTKTHFDGKGIGLVIGNNITAAMTSK